MRWQGVFAIRYFTACLCNHPVLQQLFNAIISTWCNISAQWMQHLVEFMRWRIYAVLKAKGGATHY